MLFLYILHLQFHQCFSTGLKNENCNKNNVAYKKEYVYKCPTNEFELFGKLRLKKWNKKYDIIGIKKRQNQE